MTAQLPRMNATTLLRTVLKRPGRNKDEDSLPPLSSRYRLDGIRAADVARYNALLGFPANQLPLPYYYVIAQRAHIATLLDKAFPFAVAGTVHVENELIEHEQAQFGQAMELATSVRIEPPGDTGARYCLLVTVAESDGRRLFTCRSTYLVKRGRRKAAPPGGAAEHPYPVIGQWTLSSAAGREYAAVSGDWNPIHLWKWSARLMGFESPIIHGMHTVAKACAAIQSQAGRRITAVSARFKSPIALGEVASIALSPDQTGFTVFCHDRVAVQGTLGFAPDPTYPKQ